MSIAVRDRYGTDFAPYVAEGGSAAHPSGSESDSEDLSTSSISVHEDRPLSLRSIRRLRTQTRQDPLANKIAQAAMVLAMAPDPRLGDLDDLHSFSHQIVRMAPFDQRHTGRCWLFAACNTLRAETIHRHNLKEDFGFSLNYLNFFHLLEQANTFLNFIMETRRSSIGCSKVSSKLDEPVSAGGHWQWAASLIEKYGLVPNEVMPITFNSADDDRLIRTLSTLLRNQARDLRDAYDRRGSLEAMEELLPELQEEVFNLLTASLGTPPERFDWTYKDNKGREHEVTRLTPKQFMKRFAPFQKSDYIPLKSDPRKPVHTVIQSNKEDGVNIIGDEPKRSMIVRMAELTEAAYESVLHGEPAVLSIMVADEAYFSDQEVFDPTAVDEAVERISKRRVRPMTREERFTYRDVDANHDVMLSGLDDPKLTGIPRKWEILNSAGGSYNTLTKEFFDTYVTEVVVKRERVPSHLLEIWDNDVPVVTEED